MSSRTELSRLNSAINAKGVPKFVRRGGLDTPDLPSSDPRWGRLRSGVDPEVSLRDRHRDDTATS